MQKIGAIIIIILVLWLLLHKEKNQEEYHNGLVSGATLLPKLTQHYIGLQ